jgi:hypothetical protein
MRHIQLLLGRKHRAIPNGPAKWFYVIAANRRPPPLRQRSGKQLKALAVITVGTAQISSGSCADY